MRLGVLSTANIARTALIPAVKNTEHEVYAVASRDADRAQQFASQFGIPRAYGSYEELLADPELDAVYIPLPNGLHAPWAKRAADKGLPLASNAAEARELGEYCEERDVTLMEAFMYRYHPRTERVAEIIEQELGEVRSVSASFSFRLDDPEDVRLDPDLAGGSLMDVGCYAVSVTRYLLGEPDRVYATTTDTRNSGVDTSVTGIFEYGDVSARLSASFDTPEQQRYRVETTDGWLEVHDAFNPGGAATELEYEVDGRHVVESFDPVDQFALEVEHFAACVASGEKPQTGAAEAVANMTAIDALYESADRGAPITLE